jgi:hypothetical protein
MRFVPSRLPTTATGTFWARSVHVAFSGRVRELAEGRLADGDHSVLRLGAAKHEADEHGDQHPEIGLFS